MNSLSSFSLYRNTEGSTIPVFEGAVIRLRLESFLFALASEFISDGVGFCNKHLPFDTFELADTFNQKNIYISSLA